METLDQELVRSSLAAVERPIDRGRVRVRFGDGDADDLRRALAAHQHPDGGFGEALEPDFRLPDSSAMATTVGLQYLVAAGATTGWAEVQAAIGYLVATWDDALPGWEPVPAAIDDHPRAPWWVYRAPEGFQANPGAEAIGYLFRFSSLVPPALLLRAGEVAAAAAEGLVGDIEPHEFLCWMRLAETAPAALAEAVVAGLRAAVPLVVTTDPTQWDSYAPGPLWVAPTPASPFLDLVAPHIDAHLDYLVRSRSADGTWEPSWSWGDDPAWPVARREWRSVLTVQALEMLDAFGRLRAA